MWAYKSLSIKHFHGVSSASPHAYSLKSRYGKVRDLLTSCFTAYRAYMPFITACLPWNSYAQCRLGVSLRQKSGKPGRTFQFGEGLA